MPDTVKLSSWDSGFGQRVDAFKLDQQPGASQGTIGGGDVSGGGGDTEVSGGPGAGGGPGYGVDSGVGGLY